GTPPQSTATPPPLQSSPQPNITETPTTPEKKPKAMVSRGWQIFAIVLLVELIFTLFNGIQKSSHRPGRAVQVGEQPLDEILVQDNRSQNKIAIVEVDGVITSSPMDRIGRSMVDSIKDQLEAAVR